MKIFKSVDDRIAELGFKQTSCNKHGATYIRLKDGFTHKVALLHKTNGQHILQSYDPNLSDAKNIGCTNVGLTYKELNLFLKKMKQLDLD